MDWGFSQEKFYLCLGPLPSFVFLSESCFPSSSTSLSPYSLSNSLAPSGSVRHNCVSWEIISSWPCFRSSDIFHLSSIFYPLPFFFLSPTPSLPLPFFFLSTKSFSSLIPYKHTNRISICLGEKNGKSKKVGILSPQDHIFRHFLWNSEKTLRNCPQTNRKIQVCQRSKDEERGGKENQYPQVHSRVHTQTHRHIQ